MKHKILAIQKTEIHGIFKFRNMIYMKIYLKYQSAQFDISFATFGLLESILGSERNDYLQWVLYPLDGLGDKYWHGQILHLMCD